MANSPHDIDLGGSVTIGQISNLSHNTNQNVVQGFGSGDVSPSAIFGGDSPQSTTFTSSDLATLLALNSAAFVNSGVFAGGVTTTVPFRKRAAGSKYEAGSAHSGIQCDKVLLIPTSLTARGAETASLDAEMKYASDDPFVSPVTPVTGAALSAAVFNGEYRLHKALINGVAVPELTGCTVQFGFTVEDQKLNGNWPIEFYVKRVLPTIEIMSEDIEAVESTINAAGLTAGCNIYLAKRKSGTTIEDPSGLFHIRITAANGLRQATTFGGAGDAVSNGTIRIHPLGLTCAVGVAIP